MKEKRIWLLLAAFVLFFGLSYVIYGINQKPLSYVNISINPDVQLAVNSDNVVVDVVPLNDDADVLTSDLNLKGKSIDEATDEIVDEAVKTGYIDEYSDENTVVVTAANENEKTRKTLEQRVMTQLNNHFEEKKIYAVLVAKELGTDLKTEADKYDVSNGKMMLVEEALALNSSLNKDELVKMSIQDIQKEIKTSVKARHAALKLSTANLKKKWQVEKQTLITQYKQKIQALKDSISEEKKAEFKNMTQAQKEAAIKAYLQSKKDIIKAKVNEVKAELKEELKSSYPVLENKVDTIKENIKNRIRNRNSQ